MSEIVAYQPTAIMPVMGVQQAIERRKAIVQLTKSVMQENVHYGKVPGTDKDTLLKPGAEMLTTFFGLSPRFVVEEKTQDWTGATHDGEPFFHFQYRCQLWRGDLMVGEGLGSCNSWEKKYRYRMGQRVCPKCHAEAIIKGRAEYGGGWLCFGKKGGCGAKFPDGDTSIESQEVGRVLNDSPADLVNTIDKMAQKRALVAATLIAVNASEFFTQDMEDVGEFEVVEGHYEETTTMPTKQAMEPQAQEPTHEAVPPEQWASLPCPSSYAELWDTEAYLALGYQHKNHALNTLIGKENGIYKGMKLGGAPGEITIADAWQALIDHQRSKLEAQ